MSVHICLTCREPVLFLPLVGWVHVTLQGLDHAVRVSRTPNGRGGVGPQTVAITDYDQMGDEDATFIAASRTALPAAIEALRAVLALDGPTTGENSGADYMRAVKAAIASALGVAP